MVHSGVALTVGGGVEAAVVSSSRSLPQRCTRVRSSFGWTGLVRATTEREFIDESAAAVSALFLAASVGKGEEGNWCTATRNGVLIARAHGGVAWERRRPTTLTGEVISAWIHAVVLLAGGLGHTVLDQAGTGRWAQPNSIEDLNFFLPGWIL
jgi:hypothetical protein